VVVLLLLEVVVPVPPRLVPSHSPTWRCFCQTQ
jgi:hypothetical protein